MLELVAFYPWKLADEAVCATGKCESQLASNPNPFTSALVVATFWYFLTTLIFELPVLYAFGFRSKRAITWAVIANFITIYGLHFAFAYCAYTTYLGRCNYTEGSVVIAELIVTAFETAVYILMLRKELSVKRIILATVLANACSAVVGGYIINNLLGGFH